ncbi:OLC1v1036044C1 [Oldenlandia corymbosa var. corymbosa]|uniref:OLC1v1036044C1 n=1 Tax=Oldenlandia corymbosa var. corymbosa TaxID=529605 RepID=A0AAV1CV60_OLDCO|nr:OLC1v1036044C1 [Oldenlandia corymbosa var. corymbosa]
MEANRSFGFENWSECGVLWDLPTGMPPHSNITIPAWKFVELHSFLLDDGQLLFSKRGFGKAGKIKSAAVKGKKITGGGKSKGGENPSLGVATSQIVVEKNASLTSCLSSKEKDTIVVDVQEPKGTQTVEEAAPPHEVFPQGVTKHVATLQGATLHLATPEVVTSLAKDNRFSVLAFTKVEDEKESDVNDVEIGEIPQVEIPQAATTLVETPQDVTVPIATPALVISPAKDNRFSVLTSITEVENEKESAEDDVENMFTEESPSGKNKEDDVAIIEAETLALPIQIRNPSQIEMHLDDSCIGRRSESNEVLVSENSDDDRWFDGDRCDLEEDDAAQGNASVSKKRGRKKK